MQYRLLGIIVLLGLLLGANVCLAADVANEIAAQADQSAASAVAESAIDATAEIPAAEAVAESPAPDAAGNSQIQVEVLDNQVDEAANPAPAQEN